MAQTPSVMVSFFSRFFSASWLFFVESSLDLPDRDFFSTLEDFILFSMVIKQTIINMI